MIMNQGPPRNNENPPPVVDYTFISFGIRCSTGKILQQINVLAVEIRALRPPPSYRKGNNNMQHRQNGFHLAILLVTFLGW